MARIVFPPLAIMQSGMAPRSDPTIVAHSQLRLSRDLTNDLRRRWERPAAEPADLLPPGYDVGSAGCARNHPFPSAQAQVTVKVLIMAMSSCSRLWQCNRNRPG
jgi:hypothetical protein